MIRPQRIRRRVIVHGRVQGVYFRADCAAAAREHGVHGWVSNQPDGTVYAEFEGSADAVDAMNAIVESAGDLGADPTRIVAVGGSAGGHLALATAVLDLPAARPRHRPAALVLLNPVTDTTAEFPAGFGRDCFDSDEQSRRYSPRHHVTADFPPALIMHGTADAVVHHQNSIELVDEVWRRGGGPAEIVLYPGQRHGFFNPVASGVRHPAGASDAHFELTTAETTRFLQRTVLHAQRD